MLRYWANVLLIDAGEPFFLMSGPSFWSFFTGEVCFFSIPGSYLFGEAVLLATAFFFRVLGAVGLEITKYWFENQINNGTASLDRVHSCRHWTVFCGFRLLQPLGTTQQCSLTLAAVFPSVLSGKLVCLLLSLCYGEFRKINSILSTSSYSYCLWSSRSVNLLIERRSSSVCWAIPF